MRNIRCFLFLLMSFMASLPNCSVQGSVVKNITLHYSQGDFTYQYDDDSCMVIGTKKYLCAFGSDIHSPALPLISVNVLIGPNKKYAGCSWNVKDTDVMTGVRVMPNPIPMINNQLKVNDSIHITPTYDRPMYPETPIEYIATHTIDGCQMLGFLVCPFKYDVINRKLSICETIDIEIRLDEIQNRENVTLSSYVPNRIENVKSMVINPEELDVLYDVQSPLRSRSSVSFENTIEYLIVTNDSLAEAFQPLADWKTRKGYKAGIVTVEKIDSVINDTISTQLKIKRYLKMCKDSLSTRFVLLGGDDTVVPVQKCYGKVSVWDVNCECSIVLEENIPTDLFYACFSVPFDWNRNGNSKIGEMEDSINLSQDICVTRIPVRSISDVNTFVSKQLSYETNPPIDNWHNTMLMCGNKIYKYFTINNVLMSDAHYYGEKMYNEHILGRWTGEKKKFYDTGTDFGNDTLNVSHLQAQLSNGYSFVNVSSHGNQNNYELEIGTYSVDSALTLVNKQPTIIITDACMTNAFDYTQDPCLSEAFIRNPNSGVIAYLGCSRDALSSRIDEGVSIKFSSSFYDGLFVGSDYVCFGEIVKNTKNRWINNCNNAGYRWVMFGLNPIGDPEFPIYLNQPQLFENVQLEYNNQSLTINPNLNDNQTYNVCVTGVSDDYFDRKFHCDHDTTFSDIPDDIWICITSNGYIPYQIRISNGEMIIQNETLHDRQSCSANNIIIGSNVTTSKDFGSVVVDGENVVIKATSNVYIKNDFEVKKGASIIITPQ